MTLGQNVSRFFWKAGAPHPLLLTCHKTAHIQCGAPSQRAATIRDGASTTLLRRGWNYLSYTKDKNRANGDTFTEIFSNYQQYFLMPGCLGLFRLVLLRENTANTRLFYMLGCKSPVVACCSGSFGREWVYIGACWFSVDFPTTPTPAGNSSHQRQQVHPPGGGYIPRSKCRGSSLNTLKQ